ncbi:MAG: exopolysaccharide biosynthesis polyprenyl glycosylphosphotransferase [Thermoleophilaceae bacterium]|nr:exopolysaccharide biosynthesis polyprenyl glycosylphosphotransferase [Thermoleophilaceae bacterium]
MEASIGNNTTTAMRSLNDPVSVEQRVAAEATVESTVAPNPVAPIDLMPPEFKPLAGDAPVQNEQRTVLREAPRPFTLPGFGGDALDTERNTAQRRATVNHSFATALSDVAAVVTGPLAAALVAQSVVVFIVSAMLVLATMGRARRLALGETAVLGMAPLAAALGAFVAVGSQGLASLGLAFAAAAAALIAGGITALILRSASHRLVRTRIAIVGSASHAHELAWELQADRNKRYEIVGYVARNDGQRDRLSELRHVSFRVRHLGALSDLETLVDENNVDLIVLAEGNERLEVFERASRCAEHRGTRLVSLGAFNELVFQRVPIEELNAAWLQHIMHPRYRPAPRVFSRLLDILGSAFLLVLSAPLLLLSALAIKLEDRGPVIYSQLRCGERGSTFTILKFRSMRVDAEANGARWSSSDDDRVTRVGHFIRRFHIDELPQLINVLRGEMSLVGPRPERPEFVYKLEQEIPFYGRRHLVKPGITGWAQVRAGYGLSDEGAAIKLSRDLFYLKHQSLFLYAYVLLATGWTVLTGSVHDKAQ